LRSSGPSPGVRNHEEMAMQAQTHFAKRSTEEGSAMGTDEHTGSGTPRVLIVDDDEKLVALARLALSKNGVEVETAVTSAEALESLENRDPDLVILDIVLPDISGWEVLRRIRESSGVPVMLLSGRDSDVDKARGLDLGADDYLTKPFSFMEFEARVRALLRRAGERDGAER